MNRNTITVTIFSNTTEHSVKFPSIWVICQNCEGCATDRGRSVECDGGGFTSSEWAEQDDDFQEDYLAGRYDRPCDSCDGLGRVQTIDEDAVVGWRENILLKAYLAQEQSNRDCDAEHEMERRMGA